MKRLVCSLAAMGLCATPLLAQAPDAEVAPSNGKNLTLTPPPGPGIDALGDHIWGPIDVESQSGQNGMLGVAHNGREYHVSSRVITDTGGRDNKVYTYDAAGVLTGEYSQISGAIADSWGYRDGMSDGQFLYFGWGGGVARHNLDGTGGVLHIAGGGPNGTWRALAYDPNGDGGNGSFYTGDFSDPINEHKMDGTLIRSMPNFDGWSIYGATIDPCTGNLWVHHRAALPEVWEIDTTTERWTGVSFPSDAGMLDPVQGGLSGVFGGVGGSGNFWDFIGLLQATPDSIAGFEGYVDRCGGGDFTLELRGDCPGPMTAVTTNGTANERHAFIRAMGEGNVSIPPGNTCEGTMLGLNATAVLAGSAIADGDGSASLGANVPQAACRRVFLQALDTATCDTSNVVLVGG